MINILFVCTGNTCRSPMAEALLKSMASNQINVKSAGVFAENGSEASLNTQQILADNGIEVKHKSALLTMEKLEWATYIFTMTSSHKQAILARFPEISNKLFTLKEFVEDDALSNNADISDPFGGSINIYRNTYDEMVPLIKALCKKLAK